MENDIKKWASNVYAETTYGTKTSLVAYSSEFSLFNKKASTEYVGRMSPTAYAPSQWFVLKNFDNRGEVRAFPENVSLFFKEGKLLKSDQDFIKENFNIVIEKKEKVKKEKFENKSVVFIEKNVFSPYSGVSKYDFANFATLISSDEKSITILKKDGEKKNLLKHKFNIKIVNSDEAEFVKNELNAQIENFNEKFKELSAIKINFLKQFEE